MRLRTLPPAAALVFCALAAAAAETAPPPVTGSPAVRDIAAYGPNTDGNTDNTALFQRALDETGASGGGIVQVGTGRYRFDGTLTIPSNVTLRGTFTYSPAHAGVRDRGHKELPVYGSVLEPRAGAGSEEGPAFITLMDNASLQGFTVHYPDQLPDAGAPTPYPYTVAMRGNNPALTDMQLLNPFNAIDASQNQRALVRNIHGQPIHIGLFVDAIYDIGRVENVHWNPWWSFKTKVYEWQMENGVGFLFGRTDWHYVLNTFCFGYNVGYKFMETEAGGTNGNFLGIGADDCHTSLVVEESAPMGILITNGEFVSFHGPDPTMVRVEKTHTGTVRLVNCAFWGPARRNAVIDGTGTVGFSDCTFMQWGHEDADESGKKKRVDTPSLDILGGSVSVRGCEFLENRAQVRLGPAVDRAIVTENLVNGKPRVENKARNGVVIVKDNAGTPDTKRWAREMERRKTFRAAAWRAGERDGK